MAKVSMTALATTISESGSFKALDELADFRGHLDMILR